MERLVRTEGAVSWRTRTVLRWSAMPVSALALAGSLAYAATKPNAFLAALLPQGSYPIRVAMPDIPEVLRTGFVLRNDIPALAVPPELAVEADEGGGEPVAVAAADLTTADAQSQPAMAGADFLTSFSDLTGNALITPAKAPSPAKAPARSGSANDANVLDINYDLLAGPESTGAVEIRKGLRRGDASLGALRLQVDRNAGLYASRADLARMLPAKAAQLDRLGGDYLSLSRLREAGVNLRYDAAHDELVVQD